MPTFLFNDIIFGPVQSRRMGVSLGVNLLPQTVKYCNFNCVYCECGFTPLPTKEIIQLLPTRAQVKEALEERLSQMNPLPDAITFAGNGEPTIHPEFAGIIDDVTNLRNKYAPQSEVVVLTNATQMHKAHILQALSTIDRCMFKLDSAIEATIQAINQPAQPVTIESFIEKISKFKGKIIIQTLFIRGSYNNESFNNTTPEEVSALIEAYKKINPFEVVVYGIQRDTPIQTLTKISKEELESIAQQIRTHGLSVSISY
jgi:wyosine [tRNA(Phe)-imidazoG37] synthetase (radical SAM superfamily)